METPKSAKQLRPTRNPTPRLSERKKSLFNENKIKEQPTDDMLHGITPLSTSQDVHNQHSICATPKSKRCIEALLASKGSSQVISFFDTDPEKKSNKPTSTRRSLRLNKNTSPCQDNISPIGPTQLSDNNGKENIPVPFTAEEGSEEQLQILFSASMRLNALRSPKSPCNNIDIDETSEEEDKERGQNKADVHKRHHEPTNSTSVSPRSKMAKVESPLDNLTFTTKSFYSISNKSPDTSPKSHRIDIALPTGNTSSRARRHERRSPQATINKGVRHKIRRRPRHLGPARVRHSAADDVDLILSHVRNEKLHNLIASKRKEQVQIEKAHSIFRSGQNPITMARPLSALGGAINENDDSNNNNTADVVHEKKHQAKYHESDFSDIEYDGSEEDDNTASECESLATTPEAPAPVSNRKFFKSGRASTTRMEVRITDNIRASVCNGKISLVQEKKRVRKKIKISNVLSNEFSDEQASVDAILKNLDDTAFGDVMETSASVVNEEPNDGTAEDDLQRLELFNEIEMPDSADYGEFRKRLPYNTTNPEIIEQQHLLLDFLISNNICNEKNFTIFIADPENHKEEASRIVDDVVVVVNEHTHFRDRLPYNTCDTELISQQHSFLDFLIEHDICNEDNFDIFIGNYEQRRDEAEAIVTLIQSGGHQDQGSTIGEDKFIVEENLVEDSIHDLPESSKNDLPEDSKTDLVAGQDSAIMDANLQAAVQDDYDDNKNFERLFPIFYPGRCQPLLQQSTRQPPQRWIGEGANQYQIDAGQKSYGAQQCKQCGLVYTVHEPEEERLHRDYHASIHVLRFKGWIDEDIVAIFTEWGPDGRILRVTESSHIKRRERLTDILKIVDKELGFSSYIVPKIFVAYIAVRKNQIVGLCLVQPLRKANKYICSNGVDCCTEEEFDAKCGISRVWVSPLHRRLRIGSKLIQAVQVNTIFGEEIALDKIAFSAPTVDGKMFAQKVTQTENFLVYQ